MAESKGDRYCFAAADGLGGHSKGEVASRLICETAMSLFADEEEHSPEEMFRQAQEKLMERRHQDRALDKWFAGIQEKGTGTVP